MLQIFNLSRKELYHNFFTRGYFNHSRIAALSTLHKKMMFCIKDFFGKYHQIRSFLRIWSHLRKKSLCAVQVKL